MLTTVETNDTIPSVSEIEKRIDDGEKGLRKVWHCDNAYDLTDYELPSSCAKSYLMN